MKWSLAITLTPMLSREFIYSTETISAETTEFTWESLNLVATPYDGSQRTQSNEGLRSIPPLSGDRV